MTKNGATKTGLAAQGKYMPLVMSLISLAGVYVVLLVAFDHGNLWEYLLGALLLWSAIRNMVIFAKACQTPKHDGGKANKA